MSAPRMRIALFAGAASVALLAAAPARADEPADHKAAAQVLFERGRAFVEQGNFAQACPQFAESERLDPGLGTMLWLADCYENVGKMASAWAEFKEAAAAAALKHDQRESIARDRAEKLEHKLSHLTIVVPTDMTAEGLEVKRDGIVVGSAEWGLSVPLDPGIHTLTATAPGKPPWSRTVDVRAGSDMAPVTVFSADVAPAPEGAATAAAPASETEAPKAGEPWDVTTEHPSGTRRVLTIGAMGLGAAGIVVGSIFSLKAKSRYDESNTGNHCNESTNQCDAIGKQDRNDAFSLAAVATVAMGLGVVAAAGGVALYVTAPSAAPSSVALEPRSGGGAVKATWSF